MNVMGNSGLKTLKSKILVDGEVHIAERKALVPVMQAFARKPVPLKKDKTVIEFVGTSSKDPKIEIHTTVTVSCGQDYSGGADRFYQRSAEHR